MLTEQMLRRSPALAVLNPFAAAHHERARRIRLSQGPAAGRVERGARSSRRSTSTSGSRPTAPTATASSETRPPIELRRLASEGALDAGAVEAVLAAAGHDGPPRKPAQHPGGLTLARSRCCASRREGLTTKAIADRLYISPKTADHHIQHVYTKIGVSTRAAAALWAMEHELVR